jgi:uncharacterized membrane protein (UPF0127 family)
VLSRPLLLGLLTLALVAVPAASRAEDAIGQCGDALAPYAEVQIETQPRLSLEVARTPDEHQVGLMYRPSLPQDSGMLFVYDHQAIEGYWMHNTYVPLSIAWIDQNGAIVDIQDMLPQTDDVHWPAAPYWYALEANQGWFMNNGVGVGQYVTFCLGA